MSKNLADPDKQGGGKGAVVLALIKRNRGVFFPVGAILVMLTFFIPLPPLFIDVLICMNLALTFIVVMKSLSISTPLQLTSYPTILLITPIFRLCLSLAVTRSILETGHAGEVISMIGSFSARGNLVVAFVTFVMILFVQFIVVTKGAERVAEVAARFTLDAMPGKQMAIDADLRSGLIQQDQARRLRGALQRESQLYGAMDGAMKFVKGDSVATIVLALVNLVGGLVVGVIQRGMSVSQAAQKYTILTVGDGLAAIITSMMVATAAGFVITRVNSEEERADVGSDLVKQFFSDPKPLWLTCGALLAMGLIPGAPTFLLLVVGGGLGAAGYGLYRSQTGAAPAEVEEKEKAVAAAPTPAAEIGITPIVPIAVAVSPQLAPLIDPGAPGGAKLQSELAQLRSSLYYDLGVLLPQAYAFTSPPIQPNAYLILIKEVLVDQGMIRPDCLFINDSAENVRIFGIEGEDVSNPADLRPGAWIPAHQRHLAEAAGLKIWEPGEIIPLHLSRILKRCAHEFIGLQEAQTYLNSLASSMPALVAEVVPKAVALHQFTDVLQRLSQEGISIRDIKSILDALNDWGRIERDPVMLTEYVRSSLKRYITYRYAAGRQTLYVYLLDPEIEDVISGAIRRTPTGSFLSLDPALSQEILGAFRREISPLPAAAQKPVILTDMEIRRFIKKMVEMEFPYLAVLSYQELTPDLIVQPIARISMRSPQIPHSMGQPEESAALALQES